jgi:hypothetical protein
MNGKKNEIRRNARLAWRRGGAMRRGIATPLRASRRHAAQRIAASQRNANLKEKSHASM